ncbi:hypothetical protein GF371_02035 [Candidatus Woesearchaeota archaeon]|nr:hypothetical protein [Candidatus Woesearchaeota archaeon]
MSEFTNRVESILGPDVFHILAQSGVLEKATAELDDSELRPEDLSIEDRIVIDAERGILHYTPTQADIDEFSELTDDHNEPHKENSRFFDGNSILHGNYIAALAESLARPYFLQHQRKTIQEYFEGSLLGKLAHFFVRRRVIGSLNYSFKEAFHPGQQLELRVKNFMFTKADEKERDCKFKMECELIHPESDKKGRIYIEYLVKLPESPDLTKRLQKDEQTVTHVDEIVLDEEDLDTYRKMLRQPGDYFPVLFPVVRTNSRILIKEFNKLKEKGEIKFDTGIYHKYNIQIYSGARKLKTGDKLKVHYVPDGRFRRNRQKVKVYVTNEDDKILYEFNAPIYFMDAPKRKPLQKSAVHKKLGSNEVIDAELN